MRKEITDRQKAKGLRNSPKGFTFIEAMTALTVLAVLVMIALPSIQTGMRNVIMQNATQEVMHMVDFARVQAQSRNRAYGIVVSVAAGTITLNESTNTRCSGLAGGLADVRQMTLGANAGAGERDFPEVNIVAIAPNSFQGSPSLCIKPDGRVLLTSTGKPVPSTNSNYGAGEARISIQLGELGSSKRMGVVHSIVIPYNGIPTFAAGL